MSCAQKVIYSVIVLDLSHDSSVSSRSSCVLSHDFLLHHMTHLFSGKAVDLSFDHKPTDPPELERIERAGGKVGKDGRVNGGLNLSRALGDHFYKEFTSLPLKDQMISSFPDVERAVLDDDAEFIVLACDGIW